MEEGKSIIKNLSKEEGLYFKHNPDNSQSEKAIWLESKLNGACKRLDDINLNTDLIKYLKGCALNVGNKYNSKAEEILIDVAKMNPTMYEIWNELGDCIWKKGDKKGAQNCFERALNHERNKVSLRNLSIVMRQQENVTKEQIEESVKISKDAVSLDVSDGTSWYILGNAYLAQFFLCGQYSNVLQCSLNAYTKASDDEKVLSDPDYHYNKGMVFKYLDDYKNAIAYFTDALTIHPQFTECKNELSSLKDQLVKTNALINNKGKLKSKKLIGMMKNLSNKNHSQNPTKVTVVTNFEELSIGSNKEKSINCVLVSSVVPEVGTPFVCICLDAESNCFAVNLYNIDSSKAPKLGDILTVPFPQKAKVNITINEELCSYGMIRVASPLSIMVNSRQLSKHSIAPLKLTTTART